MVPSSANRLPHTVGHVEARASPPTAGLQSRSAWQAPSTLPGLPPACRHYADSRKVSPSAFGLPLPASRRCAATAAILRWLGPLPSTSGPCRATPSRRAAMPSPVLGKGHYPCCFKGSAHGFSKRNHKVRLPSCAGKIGRWSRPADHPCPIVSFRPSRGAEARR